MEIWNATMLGMLSGVVGTGLGGILSFAMRNPSKRFVSVLMHLTGGIMLATVCFHLLPESFEAHSIAMGLAGLFLGVLMVMALDVWISRRQTGRSGFLKTGMLIAAGIALHNFPEGLAIGSGYASAPALGIGVCALIMIHDLPEGIAMGIPLREGGMGFGRVVLYTVISGIPTGLGALLGYGAGIVSTAAVSMSMGLAAGAMLYLISAELIPQSISVYKGAANGLALAAGVALGIVLGQWVM